MLTNLEKEAFAEGLSPNAIMRIVEKYSYHEYGGFTCREFAISTTDLRQAFQFATYVPAIQFRAGYVVTKEMWDDAFI